MLLNSEEIKTLDIVGSPKSNRLRSTSYDVSVGSVIGPDGRRLSSLDLPPQQMVMVVSAEKLFLPKDIAGYAMPKTGLSNKGILALSTGIVDPGYEGRVSSILINFGKNSFPLDKGEPFLRIAFHRTEELPSSSFVSPPKVSDDARKDVAMSLPDTFLDIPKIEERVADNVWGKQRTFLTNSFGMGSLFLAFLALVLAVIVFLGAPWVDAHFSGGIRQDVAREIRSEEVQPLEQKLSRMEGRLESLENSQSAGQN